MKSRTSLLAIDQGTTSSRSVVFDRESRVISLASQELTQFYPKAGWVEHDPEEIWQSVLKTSNEAIQKAGGVSSIRAMGITNQRETIVVWDRKTGEPIYNAIVWQDHRTADICHTLRGAGIESMVRQRTGLLLDSYFSATKLTWILDHIEGARKRAEKGCLAFGTIDSFLLWRLTDGKIHATDVTNACRTLLYNIHTRSWDPDLLTLFRIPGSILPKVYDNDHVFGETVAGLFGQSILIAGVAGDQQASLIGQAGFQPGHIKATYGTGCFLLANTGAEPFVSRSRLLTTIGYRIKGQTVYALEGVNFIAGAAVKWLRDQLALIQDPSETNIIARSVRDNHGLYLVPAFVGLGAPYWAPNARGMLYGLALDTSAAHIVRATLESISYQTSDLIDAIQEDGCCPTEIRIDGGMSNNDWFCQFLADILNFKVDCAMQVETTALGAAFIAGLNTEIWNNLDDLTLSRKSKLVFTPKMSQPQRSKLIRGWNDAVRRTLQPGL